MNLPESARRAVFLYLTPEAAVTCLWFRWRLWRDRVAVLRAPAPETNSRQRGSASDVSRAVYLVASLLPGTACLPMGLAVRRMLARRGHVCRLEIGVSKKGGFHAHAWVTGAGGQTIHGKIEESFHPLTHSRSEAG